MRVVKGQLRPSDRTPQRSWASAFASCADVILGGDKTMVKIKHVMVQSLE